MGTKINMETKKWQIVVRLYLSEMCSFCMRRRHDKSNTDFLHLVRMYVANKQVQVIVSTATMTVLDLIANMGGTLGLFCGFSVLSAVEAAYWGVKAILRYADRCLKRRRKTKNNNAII